MQIRLFFLLAITMSILPITSSTSYFSHAQSLPSYCTVENGQTICIINILPFEAPESYDPGVAEIPVGAKVIFKNTGPEIHTATSTDATEDEAAPSPNGIFDTGIVGIDEESVPIIMDEAGVFRFFCAVHPDMRGTLIVGDITQNIQDSETPSPTTPNEDIPLEFSSHLSSDTSITGGELPITKISSVGDKAYIIDGTTPAGGHDAFSYDGSGYMPTVGQIQVDLDPDSNTGSIIATWTDPSDGSTWKLKQTKFGGGNEMYIGETIDGVTQTKLDADPVAINHFEHGTTSAGPPVEPTLFVYLASWGPSEVWKNGENLGTFETHMMVTEGARNEETGKIVKSDGTTPYSPMTPGDSSVNHDTAQLHLVFHTPAGEKTNNFPPPFESFTHVMFHNLDPQLPVTHVIGNNAYIIDGTTPAGGHDAFSYDGSGHKKLQSGTIEIDLDPVSNTGSIIAAWTDIDGNKMMLKQTKFGGGNEMYIGETIDGVTQTKLDADPVAINHFEHGTTSAGPPVEPTLFVYLASWGPSEVWKNGENLGTFETHMMVTEGARNPDSGTIVKSDGTTPYSPMTPGDSSVNHDTAQLHLVFHTPAGEKTNNFPPPFEVFTHLMFYDLDVLPNVAAQTPEPTPSAINAPGGGGCLIATATYGSELAPQVQQLREFRDNTLLKTDSGSAFMDKFNELYYSFSPTIADWERQSPLFKEVVKTAITPLVTSLSILNYVDVDSEAEVLGYGISLILLNIGMYFVAPAFAIMRISRLVR